MRVKTIESDQLHHLLSLLPHLYPAPPENNELSEDLPRSSRESHALALWVANRSVIEYSLEIQSILLLGWVLGQIITITKVPLIPLLI